MVLVHFGWVECLDTETVAVLTGDGFYPSFP